MTEIDINGVDKKVREFFHKIQGSITNIDKEIKEYEELLTDELKPHIKKDLQNKIKILNDEKTDILISIQNKHFYTIDYIELVETKNKETPKKISFMEKKPEIENELIEGYKKILKKYNLEHFIETTSPTSRKFNKSKSCKNSSCNSKEFIHNTDYEVEICTVCGTQREVSNNQINYKDNTRVNTANKYNYERSIHFKDTINQLQGKQNSTIPLHVYQDLEKQLDIYNLLVGDKNTPKHIRYQKVTKQHIMFFLKETKHSKHYEDCFLIYHNMTGKKLDDISHLENKLLEDFNQVSMMYDKLYKFTGKVDRKSFINSHYVLYQLLIRHKYPCDKRDFNMLKTLELKNFHDTVLANIFSHLEWSYTSSF